MSVGQAAWDRDDNVKRQRDVKACDRLYWRLRDHHPEQFRKNLIEIIRSRQAHAQGIEISATSRSYAASMAARNIEIRSSGNGEAI